jgi:carboxymethylenebutenolidase
MEARKTAKDFNPEVLQLFDAYVHGAVDRRGFLEGASKYATATVSAAMLLDMLSPNFAAAQVIAPEDKRIKTEWVTFPSPQGNSTTKAYLVRPANATGKLPGILVVHENRGLNPHIQDIARRLAIDGFMALAPDALAPVGGYPGDEQQATQLFGKLEQPKSREDFVAAANYLKTRADCTGNIGAVGFCYGGGIVNMLATRLPDLKGAVPFYGGQPTAEDAAKIKSPMLLHYAGNDTRIDAGWPAFEEALKKANVQYEGFIYPGVEHGFNNDTTPRFDKAAAALAWERTIAFFKKNVH